MQLPSSQFARQFLEKGNMVIAGARDVHAPGLLDLQKLHPDNLFISEVDVENQRSIIVWPSAPSTVVALSSLQCGLLPSLQPFTLHACKDMQPRACRMHGNARQSVCCCADMEPPRVR